MERSVTVKLDDALYEEVKGYAHKMDISISEFVRRSIQYYVKDLLSHDDYTMKVKVIKGDSIKSR